MVPAGYLPSESHRNLKYPNRKVPAMDVTLYCKHPSFLARLSSAMPY